MSNMSYVMWHIWQSCHMSAQSNASNNTIPIHPKHTTSNATAAWVLGIAIFPEIEWYWAMEDGFEAMEVWLG